MTQSIAIRNYQNGDREHCRSLWRELAEWHREIYQDPTIGGEHPEDYFDRHLSKVGPTRIWVATSDSEAVGLIGLAVDGYEAEIEPLIVTKAYRHRGIGTQLVETVISEARKIGTSLNVAPVARNVETIQFFYKLGFKNLGRVELFIDFSNRTWKPSLKLHGRKLDF